ncbi:alpha/beta hydrolase [Halobacillus mangrovi]|uniref:alpha/beta hydrolase n=1 Tax=Halobacillus mangrovi TaxID=402384 RepID=UPI003D970BC4
MEMTNVLKGADPIYFKGNEVGILVSHGFTGTTQSMRPLAEAYARAGYTVCAPRLKGHGTTPEDMEKSTKEDWIESIDEGYRWLKDRCEVIFTVGLSMGGTLALYVAQNYPDIEGVIPINAAIDIPAMENTEAMDGPFTDAIGSDIKMEDVEELAYERTPVRSIDQLLDLMSQVKSQLSSVHCPILVFVSDEDHVVPPHNSEVIFDTVFSEHKEIVHLENSYHVATLDNDQDLIIERSLEFFQMYTKTK